MKINYERFKELNLEAITEDNTQLASFYIIQSGVERYLEGDISEQYKDFLVELRVLVDTEEKTPIVSPHKMVG